MNNQHRGRHVRPMYRPATHDGRGGVSPESWVLHLQGAAGNRAVTDLLRSTTVPPGRALAGLPVQRFRDFAGAHGVPTSDYKIVNGHDATFGPYHIKFHNLENMDVFDEIHVVFEAYDRTGYFFYDDAGKPILSKSSGRQHGEALTKRAQEIVDQQLNTSATVPNEVVVEMRRKKEEQRLKDEAVKEQWQKENQAKEAERAKQEEAERKAAAQSADEEKHLRHFLSDNDVPGGYTDRILSYLRGQGPKQAVWDDKLTKLVDWYQQKSAAGWVFTLPPQRLNKAKSNTYVDEIRKLHALPKDVEVTVAKQKSGQYFNCTATIRYGTYTQYAADPARPKT